MDPSVNQRLLLDNSDGEEESLSVSNTQNDEKPIFKPLEPKDKYLTAYIIFYLLGMITLLPWNFFITANDYWMYKFRDPQSNVTVEESFKRTPLQTEFTSYLSIASNVPTILFLALNAALNHRITLQHRVIGSLMCMFILFMVTAAFVNINTDSWQTQFFIITLVLVVLLNMFSAILAGSIFGIIGKFSVRYITAVVGGQALGGIFTSATQIASLAVGASSIHSAFVYFLVANVMILLSLVSYIFLSKTVYFKFHISDKMGVGQNEFQNEMVRPRIICHKSILKRIWVFGVSEFLVFAITLVVYPSVTVLIESEQKGNRYLWNDVYFVPVVSYLLFNTGDYFGRIFAGFLQWPRKGWVLFLFNLTRLVFIPLIILCNAQPRHHLPVIFNKDYYYIIIMSFFAFTNGYLANLGMMFAPRAVEQHEKESASSIMALFLGMGLTLGSAFSLLLVKLL